MEVYGGHMLEWGRSTVGVKVSVGWRSVEWRLVGVEVSGGGGQWRSYVRVVKELSRSGGQCGVDVSGGGG